MATTFNDAVRFNQTVTMPATVNNFPLAGLPQRDLMVYNIPLTQFRVWDAIAVPLPGDGQLEEATAAASYYWDPNSADDSFFVAGRAYRVLGITARVEVVGTDAGAVTAAVKKAASGTDIASGTALHTGTIDLKGTVDTNQALTLSATSADLDIASGTCIGIDFTGTLTAARGCVTVALAPAPSPDDLRLVGGTFGTGAPRISAGDLKAAGATTRRARVLIQLPAEYVAGQTVTLRLYAGMETTVADVSATVDVEAYLTDYEGAVSGSDLVTTAATSINSLTFAEKDFQLTATSLSPGDWLDVTISIAVNDAASGTAVDAAIGYVDVLCDTRG